MAPRGIVIEIIGDDRSYIRAAENTIATNTKLDASYKALGVNAKLSADAQIAAAVKAREAQQASIAGLRTAALARPAGVERDVGLALAAEQQAKLNRQLGISTASARQFSNASKESERAVTKLGRGVLAGSGALGGFGRSLAFASSGFIAVELGAALVSKSILAADDLKKAQDSLAVAIQHTGGNLRKLTPEYTRTAKAAAEFGIDQVAATTGLARATVLTGNAAAAQRAYQEALVISKATGKDFNTVLTATAKGQEGITTSLRRYGILVDATSSGTEQFAKVMARFGGQAEAATTPLDRLKASFQNTLTAIGVQLLPTVDRLAESFSNWLTEMNKTGRLQKDVAAGMTLIHDVTAPLITDIKLLADAFRLANKGLGELGKGFGALSKVKIPGLPGGGSGGKGGGGALGGILGFTDKLGAEFAKVLFFGPAGIAAAFEKALKKGPGSPAFSRALQPAFFPQTLPSARQPQPQAGQFGTAKPAFTQIANFQLNATENLQAARAALTRSTQDDVAGAKAVIARIRRLIDQGRLHGKALVQALQAEGSALSTVWAAEDAAAQKRAAAAQAAKAKVEAQIQAQIDPINLEIALARAQISGKSTVAILKKMREAALKVANNTKVSAQDQLQALQQVIQIQGQLKDATKQQAQTFQVPAKLSLGLARDQALGKDTTKDLLAIRKSILKFISTHRKNIQALTDAYNQLTSINQQLGQTAQSALGLFKQASTRALTQGLGLTAAQQKQLRARLSQLGPGGTVAADGTGAFGFVIGDSGRPIQVQVNLDGKKVSENTTTHQQRRRRRNPSQRRGPHAGG